MTAHSKEKYLKALAFATQKHSGQLRIGGAPYITHPVAVAHILQEDGYGLDFRITALFHDLLEDTDATPAEIAALSNDTVLTAVLLLTKQKGGDMQAYISEIQKNPLAKAVKAADRLHNLQSAMVANQAFKRKYILGTTHWYMDFSPEIPKAVKILAQSMEQPIPEISFLYEPSKLCNNDESEINTMDNDFTVERAMKAPTVEALIALAHENGVMLPLKDATDLFANLHRAETGALSDEALDAASGGKAPAATPMVCPICHTAEISITWENGLAYRCGNANCSFVSKSVR